MCVCACGIPRYLRSLSLSLSLSGFMSRDRETRASPRGNNPQLANAGDSRLSGRGGGDVAHVRAPRARLRHRLGPVSYVSSFSPASLLYIYMCVYIALSLSLSLTQSFECTLPHSRPRGALRRSPGKQISKSRQSALPDAMTERLPIWS